MIMKNKNKHILLITIAILLIACSLQVSFAADKTVDQNNGGDYNNIKDAVNAASTDSSISRIIVNNGTYLEHDIIINTKLYKQK